MNEGKLSEKLKSRFPDGERRILFWYDADGDYSEAVDRLDLAPVQIFRLTGTNQFEAKYQIERTSPDVSFLLYAPYSQPKPEEDFLLDVFLYSEEFHFDRIGILCSELNAPASARQAFARFQSFFNSGERTAKFKRLSHEYFGERDIALGIMAVLSGAPNPVLDEILPRILFCGGTDIFADGVQDVILGNFEKYGVLDFFWREAEHRFGYKDSEPDLFKLAVSLFLTDLVQRFDEKEIPSGWEPYLLSRVTNVSIFFNMVRNSSQLAEPYRILANKIAEEFSLKKALAKIETESLSDRQTFDEIDQILIERTAKLLLVHENASNTEKVRELCAARTSTFFGAEHRAAYKMLIGASGVLGAADYKAPVNGLDLAKQYQSQDWKIDQAYRHFYTAFDTLSDAERNISEADRLREQVEQIYSSVYLETVTVNWTKALAAYADINQCGIPRQIHFYRDRLEGKISERTAVIISDALRYETAQELLDLINSGVKRASASIDMLLGPLPSITELGMTALLPHTSLGYAQEKFTIDGDTAESIEKRRKIIQKQCAESGAFQYAEIQDWKSDKLREMFSRGKLFYIYHNQIDARGDKAVSEKDVFKACEDTFSDILKLVTRLSNSANVSRFIITADHGFLYRRDTLKTFEKIAADVPPSGKRYAVTTGGTSEPGLRNFSLGNQLESGNTETVIVPIGPQIFKHPGAGLNYVHGGASPQEILIPVIDLKMAHKQADLTKAPIKLISTNRKITHLQNVTLEFIQSEPVGGQVKPGIYDLVFTDDLGNEISEHRTYEANSTEQETSRRLFKLDFSFKAVKYEPQKTYSLKVFDKESRLNTLTGEWPFTIDIIFSDDFGF